MTFSFRGLEALLLGLVVSACQAERLQPAECTCPPPPAARCLSDSVASRFEQRAPCVAGRECEWTEQTQSCPAGMSCVDGACRAPCSQSCEGCCFADVCRPLSEQNAGLCGLHAMACSSCATGFGCDAGECTELNPCKRTDAGCGNPSRLVAGGCHACLVLADAGRVVLGLERVRTAR